MSDEWEKAAHAPFSLNVAELFSAKLPDDARGDGPCMDCGTLDTPVWFTDNATWNTVVGGEHATEDPGGFLCPICFVARAHASGLRPVAWRLYPEFPRRYAPTVHTDRSQ